MSVSEARAARRLRAGIAALRSGGLLRDQLVVIAFSTVGNAIAAAFQFVMAQLMGPEAWTDAFAALALLALLAVPSVAVNTLAIKMTGELHVRGDIEGLRRWIWRASIRVGALAGVIALGLAAASPWLGNLLRLETASVIVIVAIALVALLVSALIKGSLAGASAFVALGVVTVGETTGRLVFAVALVVAGLGAVGAVSGSAFGAVVVVAAGVVLLRYAARRKIHLGHAPDRRLPTSREQARVLLISFALAAMFNLDILFVNHVFPAETAASYSAMALIGRSLFFVASPVATVLLPHTIRAFARGGSVASLLAPSLGLIAALVTTTALVLLLFPSQIFGLVFRDGYVLDTTIMTLYTAAAALLAVTFALAQLLIGASYLRTWAPLAALTIAMIAAMASLNETPTQIAIALVVTVGVATAYLAGETARLARQVRQDQTAGSSAKPSQAAPTAAAAPSSNAAGRSTP